MSEEEHASSREESRGEVEQSRFSALIAGRGEEMRVPSKLKQESFVRRGGSSMGIVIEPYGQLNSVRQGSSERT